MMAPTVYLETSIISYLVARPSRDLVTAAHRQLTAEWWATGRMLFRVHVSEIVVEEARLGDAHAAQQRLAAIDGLPLVELSLEARALAAALVEGKFVPAQAQSTRCTSPSPPTTAWSICSLGTVAISQTPG